MKKIITLFLFFNLLFLIPFISSELVGVVIEYPTSSNVNIYEGNITNFTELVDTPASYAGEGGNCVVVNAGATALEFGACGVGTLDGNASSICSPGEYLDGSGACINLNDTIDDRATGVAGGNTTQEIRDAVNDSVEYDFTSNQSYYWDDLNDFNSTQMEQSGSTLNILVTWFTTQWEAIFGTKSTDDLTEGTTNLYENASWNESHADTLYATIGSGNASWNQSYANELYWDISDGSYNATYDNYSLNVSLNYTQIVFDTYNTTWDDASSGEDNASWNQSFANTLYLLEGENWTNENLNTLYNDSQWFNKTYTDTLYADISVVDTDTNESSRFHNLTSTDCPAGNYSYGVYENGSVKCRDDEKTAGGEGGNTTQEIRDSVNDSIQYDFISNSSLSWDTLDTYNTTQMEQSNNVLNILESWLIGLITAFDTNRSDADILSVSEVYNDSDRIDSINETISNSNESWLYTYNATYDAYALNVSLNYTQIVFDTYNTTWDNSIEDTDTNCSEGNCDKIVYFDNESLWNQTGLIDTINGSLESNYTYYSDEEWININSSKGINFNASMLEIIYYNATKAEAVVGTIDGGTLFDTQHKDANYDGRTFNFSEESGSPGLNLIINFTGVANFTSGVIRYKTSSLAGDYPVIQLWEWDDEEWHDFPVLSESETFATITQPVFDNQDHLKDGVVQMRLYKASNGNTNNHYYVDWVAIAKGFGVPAGEEIDPLSIHRDGSTLLTANWDAGSFNITAQWFFGLLNFTTLDNWLTFNGSQLSFNSTKLNTLFNFTSQIDSINSSLSLYNETLRIDSINGTITSSNESWLSTYNSTYDAYALNVSLNYTQIVFDTYNTTWDNSIEDTDTYNTTQEIRDSVNDSIEYIFTSNSSKSWGTLDDYNSTQMEQSGSTLNILVSWFTTQWNAIFGNIQDKIIYSNDSVLNDTIDARVIQNASACNDGEYLDGSGACINFNETVTNLDTNSTFTPTNVAWINQSNEFSGSLNITGSVNITTGELIIYRNFSINGSTFSDNGTHIKWD